MCYIKIKVKCLIVFCLSLLALSAFSDDSASSLPQSDPGQFVQWDDSSFGSFFLNGAVDFSNYNKIVLFPATFDRLELSKNANIELVKSWQQSSWSEMDRICNQFDTFAKHKFKNSAVLKLTDTGAEDVIALEFRLVEFLPMTQRYTDADRGTAASSYALGALGALKVQAVLANAKTGELLAVIEDNIHLDSSFGSLQENRVTHNRIWRKSFKQWVDNLHNDILTLKHANI